MADWEKAIIKFGIRPLDDIDIDSLGSLSKTGWVDGEGYMYLLSKSNLNSGYRKNGKLARYFLGNPYTEQNIGNFIKKTFGDDVGIESFTALNAHDKIALYCKSQHLSYTRSWNEIQRGEYKYFSRDADFVNPHVLLTIADVREQWSNLFDVEVTSDKYINNHTPIKFICRKHKELGEQSTVWASSTSRKTICSGCTADRLKSGYLERFGQIFWSKVPSMKNPTIDVVGEFSGFKNKIACRCNQCGCIFYLRSDHILRGIGCGKCTKSIGEAKISHWLDENDVHYIPQYAFQDCVMSYKPMPFDFYLDNYNTVVEFDGIQHFESVEFFGGDVEFSKTQKRDAFKTQYCSDHGINLIRIPYSALNQIETYLDPILNPLAKTS